jgi:hypothetical protein
MEDRGWKIGKGKEVMENVERDTGYQKFSGFECV